MSEAATMTGMKELTGSVRAARMRFLDTVEPHRRDLQR